MAVTSSGLRCGCGERDGDEPEPEPPDEVELVVTVRTASACVSIVVARNISSNKWRQTLCAARQPLVVLQRLGLEHVVHVLRVL